MSAAEVLACPRCGQADGLATIEELVGTARATFYDHDIVWDGWTGLTTDNPDPDDTKAPGPRNRRPPERLSGDPSHPDAILTTTRDQNPDDPADHQDHARSRKIEADVRSLCQAGCPRRPKVSR